MKETIGVWATSAVVRLQTFKSREEGQGLVEYGLILFLVSVVAVAALTSVGESVKSVISKVATDI